jgi:hypothetical protein
MKNPHKNMQSNLTWYEIGERKKLLDACGQHNNDEVLDIIYEIYRRNDL